jgi:hypothetical protein
VAQVLVHVAGSTQFANSEDIGAITHPSTVVPEGAGNRANSSDTRAGPCR